MTKWVDHFVDWYERQPGWVKGLLFPVVAPLMLAYSIVALTVFLVFMLPCYLLFGRRHPAESPATKFSRAEVCQHAESLDRWFTDTAVENPDAVDCLGAGPGLAKELVSLASLPELTREEAGQFAARVQRELKGYKGSPFIGLRDLSLRLAELTDNQRAA